MTGRTTVSDPGEEEYEARFTAGRRKRTVHFRVLPRPKGRGPEWPTDLPVSADQDLSSVALARLTLRAFLWDWHLDYLADTAQLIISELATNSLKYGSGTGLTSIYIRDDGPDHGSLVIEVTDDSQEMPVLTQSSPSDECHRGLVLVDQLASKWGVELLGDQKIVWATLEYDDRTAQVDSLIRKRHNPMTSRSYVKA